MTRRCSNESCFVHDQESCPKGHISPEECPAWSTGTTEGKTSAPHETSADFRVPWSGSTLGLVDLVQLTPRARTLMVGVLGSHDAGKTMLLTGSYLLMLRGESLANATFAGSRTLGAWEALAAWARFDDAARTPGFPPHTPRGTSRVPGLLHLSLRNADEEFRDVLLTDAPGEWFESWSIKEEDPTAEGARWVVKHADAFLLFADCKRLKSPARGEARQKVRQLIERLGNHVAQRPTVLVWSKADHKPSEGIKNSIRESLYQHIPHATEAESTTKDPETLKATLEVALRSAWNPQNVAAILEPVISSDPFAAFRGTYAHT